jgi:transcriptional regulator with XRE-family HTH domain
MNKERISTLLASGLKAAQVATVVGISPSRISQLLQEEDFKLLLDSKLAEQDIRDVEEVAITAKYHAAEHLLLEQITQLAPVSELRDVVGALKVVADRQDKAKTRMNPIPVAGTTIHQNIVQLTLPLQALPEIHISGNREVVGIGDNNLAPLSSQGVTSLFASRRAAQQAAEGTSSYALPAIEHNTRDNNARKDNGNEQETTFTNPDRSLKEALSFPETFEVEQQMAIGF